MLRREFLRGSLSLAGYTLVSSSFLRHAQAATGISYQTLLQVLPPNSAHLVRPTDSEFAAYNVAFNKRTQLAPLLRLLPLNEQAVVAAVNWLKENSVPFAVRCGGHSYEGFSQSTSFVIDLRLMNSIELSGDQVRVGGGAALGQVYLSLGAKNRAIAAGSCPTVGIGGHATGGGFGFLTRAYGLACDQIESFEIVTADGMLRTASASQNQDLYWACRGGGGGSFGVITSFIFNTRELSDLAVFGMGWSLPTNQAANVMALWESWAPHAPNEITTVLRAGRDRRPGMTALRLSGQTIGSISRLKNELARLNRTHGLTPLQIHTENFIGATNHFAGTHAYTTSYMAGKSDYVKTPMGVEGFAALCRAFQAEPVGSSVVMMDSYGGAVKEIAPDGTAFAHRDALFGMQYASYWQNDADTTERLRSLRQVHQAMRPYVSGGAYVNYPDGELADYRTAYWQNNLSQLQRIKATVDPDNVFHHKQSV